MATKQPIVMLITVVAWLWLGWSAWLWLDHGLTLAGAALEQCFR